jgi:ActR/RegA family two-component response regulator
MNYASEQFEQASRGETSGETHAQVAARSRIIIVDDDDSVALLARRALERPEYEFEICTDGEPPWRRSRIKAPTFARRRH